MNSQTEQPPLSHEELKKKLEEWASILERQSDAVSACIRDGRKSIDAEYLKKCQHIDASLLRACLTALERGDADTRRLDWLEKCEWMELNTFGQTRTLESSQHPGEVKGGSFRAAIDSAITTTNQQAE